MLSDYDLKECLTKHPDLVGPFPSGGAWQLKPFTDASWDDAESPIQPASIDLHVGWIYIPDSVEGRLGSQGHGHASYRVGRGHSVVVSTFEKLSLPSGIAGITFPPSALSSKAILVSNIGHIDPGYRGPLRFTLINMGKTDFELVRERDVVATLMLFKTTRDSVKNWSDRKEGRQGGEPNKTEINALSIDFADMGNRMTEIAHGAIGDSGWKLAVFRVGFPSVVGIAVGILTYLGGLHFGVYDRINSISAELMRFQANYFSFVESYTRENPNFVVLNPFEKRVEQFGAEIDDLKTEINNLNNMREEIANLEDKLADRIDVKILTSQRKLEALLNARQE